MNVEVLLVQRFCQNYLEIVLEIILGHFVSRPIIILYVD